MIQENWSPTAAVETVTVELVCDVVVNSLDTGAREWLWSRSITLSHWHKRKTLSSDFIAGLLIDSLWHGRALQGPPRWMEVCVNTEGRYQRVQVDVGWSVRKSSFINPMKWMSISKWRKMCQSRGWNTKIAERRVYNNVKCSQDTGLNVHSHHPDVNVQTTRTICVRKTIPTQMFKFCYETGY